MSQILIRTLKLLSRTLARAGAGLFIFFLLSGTARAQSWSWSFDFIDLPAQSPSLVVDSNSNLHLSYADSTGALKYAFRPAGSAKWFFMVLDKQLGGFSTKLTLDSSNNPHICYTPRILKYTHFDGKQWRTTQIDPGSGEVGYTCSIVISKEGVPHLTWYQLEQNILHIRYAVLQENTWLARTLDSDFQTGKWNSMVLDAHGNPLLSYSYWTGGELRVAHWNGKQWEFTTLDSPTRSRGEETLGPGNSLILGPDGKGHISFYSKKFLKYAHEVDNVWKIETVDPITWPGGWANFRSSIALDKQGLPHICYEDAGALKHAYWNGKHWNIQVLVQSGLETLRYSTMAIDGDNNIYVVFRDPQDSTLKLATGRPTAEQQAATAKTEDRKPAPHQE